MLSGRERSRSGLIEAMEKREYFSQWNRFLGRLRLGLIEALEAAFAISGKAGRVGSLRGGDVPASLK